MRAKLANLNHCAVPFLSRAAANLCWYYCIIYYILLHGFRLKFISFTTCMKLEGEGEMRRLVRRSGEGILEVGEGIVLNAH